MCIQIVININLVDLLCLVCMAVDKRCHLSKLSAVTLVVHTHKSFEFAVGYDVLWLGCHGSV